MNNNFYSPLKKGCKISYDKPIGISKRDVVLSIIHVYKTYMMKYSGNSVTNEDELDIEVNHFYFLSKYNLLQFPQKQ